MESVQTGRHTIRYAETDYSTHTFYERALLAGRQFAGVCPIRDRQSLVYFIIT